MAKLIPAGTPRLEAAQKFFDGDKFIAVIGPGAKSDSVRLTRSLDGAVKESDDTEGTVTHYVSTPRIDPVRDIMNPFGCNSRALDKNKAVFYNHSWRDKTGLPIGKNMWLKSESKGVVARTLYARDTLFGAEIYKLAKGGFLNSWSIGFDMTDWALLSLADALTLIDGKFDVPNAGDFEATDQVWYNKEWDLFEYSQVGIPMNEDCLTFMKQALDDGTIASDFGKALFGSIVGREKLAPIASELHEAKGLREELTEMFNQQLDGSVNTAVDAAVAKHVQPINDALKSILEFIGPVDSKQPLKPVETLVKAAEPETAKEFDASSLIRAAVHGEVSKVVVH